MGLPAHPASGKPMGGFEARERRRTLFLRGGFGRLSFPQVGLRRPPCKPRRNAGKLRAR